MAHSIESTLAEIQERLTRLESSLPTRVDAADVSRTANVPFKALWYRESLIWRMTDLSRLAFSSFQTDKLAAATILTRAAVETSAAVWYLHKNLAATVKTKAVGDIDERLKRLMMGSKSIDRDIMPEAVNVMTFVQHVDKEVEGFLHQYEGLSEYVHPNWSGAGLLYSKPDPSNFRVDFGTNIRGADSAKVIVLVNLSVSLMLFEKRYNDITELMPSFIALCEAEIRERGRGAADAASDGNQQAR
jgi:hypothetical protein